MNNQNGNAVAWTAMIIAIIALILAWAAFNRSGADLGDTIEREVNEATVEIRADFEELERDVREGTANTLEEGSDELDEAAQDARTDEQ